MNNLPKTVHEEFEETERHIQKLVADGDVALAWRYASHKFRSITYHQFTDYFLNRGAESDGVIAARDLVIRIAAAQGKHLDPWEVNDEAIELVTDYGSEEWQRGTQEAAL